jgi:hypothetical protein
MAARDARVAIPADTWTQITNDATTTDVTVALMEGGPVWIRATTSASAPTGGASGLALDSRLDGWSEATIAEKFPGLTDPDHLYAYSEGRESAVWISHG